jgi:ABC-type multidrug transport system permease subunit
VRWLLLKDLRILRRSPLLVGLLVVYPVVIAVLIGLALSRAPDKPKVAFFNQVPPGASTFKLGGQEIDASKYANQLFQSVDQIEVHSRREALDKVKSGEALAALIVPADIVEKLATGLKSPQVEVIYNNEDPVKGRLVDQIINSRLADANAALSGRLRQVAVDDINLLLDGGEFSLFGRSLNILGLRKTEAILQAALRTLPRGAPQRPELESVQRFANLAVANLGLAGDVVGTVAQPVKVKRTPLQGKRTPLDSFAVAISVTISLMFVTVLLASGMLALEREEHAFTRLVRGLVSRLGLLAEKTGLAALCASVVAVAMTCGIGIFVSLHWGRFPLWVVAIVFAAVAFGALGVAIGGLAREVRAASLLAFLLSLPIAFLALVPSGSVSGALYDVIRVISALFPFKPALEAMDNALNDTGQSLLGPLAHLAALTVAFLAVARLALRRFA